MSLENPTVMGRRFDAAVHADKCVYCHLKWMDNEAILVPVGTAASSGYHSSCYTSKCMGHPPLPVDGDSLSRLDIIKALHPDADEGQIAQWAQSYMAPRLILKQKVVRAAPYAMLEDVK